jgi:hypothetical protein
LQILFFKAATAAAAAALQRENQWEYKGRERKQSNSKNDKAATSLPPQKTLKEN